MKIVDIEVRERGLSTYIKNQTQNLIRKTRSIIFRKVSKLYNSFNEIATRHLLKNLTELLFNEQARPFLEGRGKILFNIASQLLTMNFFFQLSHALFAFWESY